MHQEKISTFKKIGKGRKVFLDKLEKKEDFISYDDFKEIKLGDN